MAANNPLAQLLQYAPGALGVAGTIAGGAIGSVVPGAGTLVGAGLGGAIGGGLGGMLGLAGQQMQASDAQKQQEMLMARQNALDTAQAEEMRKLAAQQAKMQLLANFL
jgi:phage tail tape-measure protein